MKVIHHSNLQQRRGKGEKRDGGEVQDLPNIAKKREMNLQLQLQGWFVKHPKKVIFPFHLWRFPFLAPNSEFCSASSFEAAAAGEEEHKEERKDGRERRINRRKKRLTSSSLISSGFAKGKERKQKCEIRKRQQEFEGKDGSWQGKKSFLQKMKDSKARSRNCTFQKRLNSKNALNSFLSQAFFFSCFLRYSSLVLVVVTALLESSLCSDRPKAAAAAAAAGVIKINRDDL